jgi:hypothetical protein
MTNSYSYKDKYGSYSLYIENRVMRGQYIGSFGVSLAARMVKDDAKLAKVLAGKPWAYYCDMSQCEAYTPEAAALFTGLYQSGIQLGCVLDVYQINSALLRYQIGQIRQDAGILSPISQHIYTTELECLEMVSQRLDQSA